MPPRGRSTDAAGSAVALVDSPTVTTTPSGEQPDDDKPAAEHHRSAGEELEWIGAEVEARPKVQFWIWIGIAVVLVAALAFIIVTAL